MDHVAFMGLMRREMDTAIKIQSEKGEDYGTPEDMLADFKQDAEEAGITPAQVWAIMAGKHWRAIMKYCRDGSVSSETIRSRLHDLSNYSFLLLGLIEDAEVQDDSSVGEILEPLPMAHRCPSTFNPSPDRPLMRCAIRIGHQGPHEALDDGARVTWHNGAAL